MVNFGFILLPVHAKSQNQQQYRRISQHFKNLNSVQQPKPPEVHN